MRLYSISFFMVVATGLTVHADDKSRFNLNLAKLNPLNRFKKDEPANKVKQLTEALRTDPDEKKRKAAAEELRETDAKQTGEVIPVLVASLKQDPSGAVRAAVAESIGKLKPVTPSAGVVLEAAAVNDPSDAVRKSAQSALAVYQQNGYRPSAMTITQTPEPPMAKPRPQMTAQPTKQLMAPPSVPVASTSVPAGVNRGPTFQETTEPPLARAKSIASPVISSPIPPSPVPTAPTLEAPIPAPVTQMPTPMPMPSAPKLPAPTPLPGKPTSSTPIPTPPPASNPGFSPF